MFNSVNIYCTIHCHHGPQYNIVNVPRSMCTGVALIGPVGPGLHFILKNEEKKASKFALKLQGVVTLAGPGGVSAV